MKAKKINCNSNIENLKIHGIMTNSGISFRKDCDYKRLNDCFYIEQNNKERVIENLNDLLNSDEENKDGTLPTLNRGIIQNYLLL